MAEKPDVRWRQRLQSFRRAFRRLSDAAALAAERDLTGLEQQGIIQAFEFTHELAWNVLKDYLQDQGFVDLNGPRDATRTAFKNGLIEDGDTWMAMIASRNQTSHTYNEDVADEITTLILTRYVPAYEILDRRFTDIEKEQR